jgi:hypothetical protein
MVMNVGWLHVERMVMNVVLAAWQSTQFCGLGCGPHT